MTYEELNKILLSDNPGFGLMLNREELFKLIPELEECEEYDQMCPEWHPYKLLDHIFVALNNTEADLVIRLAVLFHDIGKPKSATDDENGRHYYGHGIISASIFNQYAFKFGLDKETTDTIMKLIINHDERFEKKSEKEQACFLSQFTREELEMLYKIKYADNMGQSKKAQDLNSTLDEQKTYILDNLMRQNRR